MTLNPFVKFRIPLLVATIVMGALCAVLMTHVNVNNDMTKYLPDKSPMRKGIEILSSSFTTAGSMQVGQADIRMMYRDINDQRRQQLTNELENLPEILSVTAKTNANYTLFNIDVVDDLDQRAFGSQLRERYSDSVQIVTSQDGAAADATMLTIAVIILLVILFAMCRSWLEPPLFIISTGIAVLLNLGSNALLPSVSVTTHSIAAVLQLVLSMDYSIILANRFRQQKETTSDTLLAMSDAIRLATPSILSSAATTVVGLLVLLFMNLKIGADLGIVLAKGVMCSLVCNYTLLPALLILCSKGIDRSHKPTLPIPTDCLAVFSVKARIPLTICFVAILALSYVYRNNTPIKFSTNATTEIDKVFPKKNFSVILYNNLDSAAIPAIADQMMTDSNVEMFISYPSLLQRQYTCHNMLSAVSGMSAMAEDMLDQSLLPELTEPMLRLVYYTSHCPDNTSLKLSLRQIYDFLNRESKNPDSMMADYLDADTKSGLAMLDQLMNPQPAHLQPLTVKRVHHTKKHSLPASQDTLSRDSASTDSAQILRDEIAVQTIIKHKPASKFEDVDLISQPLTYSEMALFLGMDDGQAKTIFKMAGYANRKMTPYDFVHYVADNLFKQALMSMMVKKSEKEQLYHVRDLMDKAMNEDENTVMVSEIAEQAKPHPQDNYVQEIASDNNPSDETSTQQDHHHARHHKSSETSSFSELDLLLDSSNRFTASKISAIIHKLGFPLDGKMIDLLYLYYGSNALYDDRWTMSVEQMVNFIGDSIINDTRFEAFIGDSIRQGFGEMRKSLVSGLDMMRSDQYSLAVIVSDYPDESPATYAFIDHMNTLADSQLTHQHYLVGESNMFSEMKSGFDNEMLLVTLLTIISILLIVAISFRSLVIPLMLVAIIMTAVFIDVAVSGLTGDAILYVAYLIVQSILMGATIDYAILFTNQYREQRATLNILDSVKQAYHNSINTITTSGLIMIITPFLLSYTITDLTVSAILHSISIGALASVSLILIVLPALLALTDKLIIKRK